VLDMGALGVWLGFPVGASAKAAFNYVVFKQGKWAVTGVRIAPVQVSAEH
jgi:Na+-driven multidrug efflux pump